MTQPDTTAAEVLAVTDETFARDVREQDLPVLVDFWAQWCPPCHVIAPVLAEIAREREGSLLVRKINADDSPVSTRDYGVMSLPTLLLFRGGEPVRSIVGSRPKARLLAELDAALG
ncbi:thioredoxin [Prauserella muralis]|uniref:Thioredoxin n=1 Tax=Prauserella muralis TaxID=588067 RepID=A0A2V4AZP7_9PSEU|nr:thioredoxin [Prauserella muralis]PXY27501.1 thioredoxin [Prauserella muralis]TWE22780.1 thioredoxin [Prauserella muralis]